MRLEGFSTSRQCRWQAGRALSLVDCDEALNASRAVPSSRRISIAVGERSSDLNMNLPEISLFTSVWD